MTMSRRLEPGLGRNAADPAAREGRGPQHLDGEQRFGGSQQACRACLPLDKARPMRRGLGLVGSCARRNLPLTWKAPSREATGPAAPTGSLAQPNPVASAPSACGRQSALKGCCHHRSADRINDDAREDSSRPAPIEREHRGPRRSEDVLSLICWRRRILRGRQRSGAHGLHLYAPGL